MRATNGYRTGLLRLLLLTAAALSLLVNGGIFAHAHEFETHAHAQAAADDHHAHEPACPACDGDDRSIHCGSNILTADAGRDIAHPATRPQPASDPIRQLAGRPLVPEPPPPRLFHVFES